MVKGYAMYGRSMVVLALGATLTAAGCSFSMGEKSIAKAAVEKQVSTQLAAKVGQQPKSVTCPGSLKAKVGASMRCSLVTPQGQDYGVTTTVTSVKGSDAHFSIRVDDRPSSG